ncbi:hypothetical protein [Paramagnetospirillum magneticum]|uniref:hypothetical protein n=1 Tax=Paramagnetospirillum magneticum TaxID=84159 RepID=UPI0011D0D246|nr:hypothetical protein [Paramagnetospirillum magneticum]
MIIGWDHSGAHVTSAIRYLRATITPKQDLGKNWTNFERHPAPKHLSGDENLLKKLAYVTPHKNTYAMGVTSFKENEISTATDDNGDFRQNSLIHVIITSIEGVAYIGIPPRYRPPTLWVAHTHLGRLEAHCIFSKAVLTPDGGIHSFNPDPPLKGSRNLWHGLAYKINQALGWEPSVPKPKTPIQDLISKRRQANEAFFQKIAPEYRGTSKFEDDYEFEPLRNIINESYQESGITNHNPGGHFASTLGYFVERCDAFNEYLRGTYFDAERGRRLISSRSPRQDDQYAQPDF